MPYSTPLLTNQAIQFVSTFYESRLVRQFCCNTNKYVFHSIMKSIKNMKLQSILWSSFKVCETLINRCMDCVSITFTSSLSCQLLTITNPLSCKSLNNPTHFDPLVETMIFYGPQHGHVTVAYPCSILSVSKKRLQLYLMPQSTLGTTVTECKTLPIPSSNRSAATTSGWQGLFSVNLLLKAPSFKLRAVVISVIYLKMYFVKLHHQHIFTTLMFAIYCNRPPPMKCVDLRSDFSFVRNITVKPKSGHTQPIHAKIGTVKVKAISNFPCLELIDISKSNFDNLIAAQSIATLS